MSQVGREGIHAWTPPGEVDVAIELNRLMDDTGEPVFPHYKVRKIGGLASLGEPSAHADPHVGGDFEIARRGYRRGKTVSYQGSVVGRSREELRAGEAAMRVAFADISREGRMEMYLHPLHPDSPYSRYYHGRVLTVEIDDELASPRRPSQGWESPFVVAVRWSDPRYYEDSTGESVTITNTNTTYDFA